MPYNGYTDQRQIRLEKFLRGYTARRQVARAAHRLGPKDKKNVGGELRKIRIRSCPAVAVCYTADTHELEAIS